MIRLKQLAETIKGHEITGNCFQQEDVLSKSDIITQVYGSSQIEENSRNPDFAKMGESS